MGGNAQEGTGEETVGAIGETSTVNVQGRDPTGGAHPRREGGVSGYWPR